MSTKEGRGACGVAVDDVSVVVAVRVLEGAGVYCQILMWLSAPPVAMRIDVL